MAKKSRTTSQALGATTGSGAGAIDGSTLPTTTVSRPPAADDTATVVEMPVVVLPEPAPITRFTALDDERTAMIDLDGPTRPESALTSSSSMKASSSSMQAAPSSLPSPNVTVKSPAPPVAYPSSPAPVATVPVATRPTGTVSPLAAAPVRPAPVPAGRQPAPKPSGLADSATIAAPKPGSRPGAPAKSDEPTTGVFGVDVAMRWREDIHSAHFFPRPTTVTLGPDGTFPLPPDVMGGKVSQILVEPHPQHQFGLRVDNPAMKGQLLVDGQVYDIGDVRNGLSTIRGPVVPLTLTTHAVLQFNEFTFVVSRASVPPPQRMSLWSRENWVLLLCMISAAALLLAPLIAGYNSPDFRNKSKMTFEEKMDERLAEILLIEVKPEEKPPEEDTAKAKEKEPEKAEAPIEPEKQPEVVQEREEIKKALEELPEEERKEKIEALVKDKIAKETAVVDEALAGLNAPAASRLFADDDGTGASSANPNGTVVTADPTGELGATLAVGGAPGAPRRPGVGDGSETKKGEIAALGKDGETGKDVTIKVEAKKQQVVRVGGQNPEASGELPKEVIKKYIATKMGAIKACYQKALQSNPDLAGKVKVAFLIQPNGAVGAARIDDSGLNNSSVEECILANIKSWKFPPASGGGSTKVVYPFVFASH